MTRWRVKIWCKDCYGEDTLGCFGGGVELQEEAFATEQEAQDFADGLIERADGAPYETQVFSEEAP